MSRSAASPDMRKEGHTSRLQWDAHLQRIVRVEFELGLLASDRLLMQLKS